MFFKKGQAAMEFLMTYGWAILIVLIALGALFYLGVFNPKTGNTYSATAPFSAMDVKFNATDMIFKVGASGISSAYISSMVVNGVPCTSKTGLFVTMNNSVDPGKATWTGVDTSSTTNLNGNITAGAVYINCRYPSMAVGTKASGTATVSYVQTAGGLSHTSSWDYSGTVE